MSIDLNADIGEQSDPLRSAAELALLPSVTSVNIACGFHAGNPNIMARTVEAVVQHDLRVGAHPGLPDRANFGRRAMRLTPDDVYSLILYQTGALEAFLRRWRRPLSHVKPHGALYHMAEEDPLLAQAIAYAVYDFHPRTRLVGLAGGRLVAAGRARGLSVLQEVFADRAYRPDGSLVPRSDPQALISDPGQAARRIALLLTTGTLRTIDGSSIMLQADTVCLHGDHKDAVGHAQVLRSTLEATGLMVCAPPEIVSMDANT